MGTGSLYRRKSDGRWVAAISTGPRGSQTRHVRYAKTKREAVDELDELRKLLPPPTGHKTTVSAYLRSWLDVAGRHSLKASTWRTYDVALRLHIDPAIGHIVLRKLTPEHIDHMLAGLIVAGPKDKAGNPTFLPMDAKGQRNILGVLGRILDVAVQRGYLMRNPVRLVDPPRVPRPEPRILTPPEWRRLREAIRGDRLEALWVTAVGTGLRQGELLGLRWEDIDLDRASVAVQYALVRVDGRYAMDDPKTARSRRAFAIPAFVVDALRDHRARQLAERLSAGLPTEEGLVFLSPKGRPLNGGWVSHRWRKIADGLGLPVTMHSLRHTNATVLRDRGVGEDVRMPRMGHVQAGVHRRYAHDTDSPDRRAADELQEALG